MNFNFYEEFKNHSNEELIAIARQTDAYQPDAVAAAYQHLNERQVSEDEILGTPEKNYALDANEEGQEDLLVPYLKEATPTGNKWIRILLGVTALQFLNQLFTIFGRAYKFKLPPSLWLKYFFGYNSLLTLVPLLIVFVFILKRNKLGWYLIFCLHLTTSLMVIAKKGLAVSYGYVENYSSLLTPAIAVAVSSIFVIILWKQEVADLFSVKKENKQKTALVCSILAVVLLMAQQ